MAGIDWITNLIGGPIVSEILSFIPNPEKAQEAKAKLADAITTATIQAQADQREINKIEASNPSMFVAGWRPGLGWLCVVSMGCYYLPKFILGSLFWSVDAWNAGHLVPYPDLGITEISGLVASLLGMGTLRSFDKINGTDTKGMK